MSSLWTPEGEHRVPRPDEATGPEPDAAGAGAATSEEEAGRAEMGAQLDELRRQLLSTPVEVVVANHAYGLFELAALHLSQRPAGVEQARLAIDALGALVEGMSGRLGEAEPSLVDALAQIRLAFVQVQASAGSAPGAADAPPQEPA